MPSWDLCQLLASTAQEITRPGSPKWSVQSHSQENVSAAWTQLLCLSLLGAVQRGESNLRHKPGIKLFCGSLAPCLKVRTEFN